MRKWMVEFLRNFLNRSIKIARVKLIFGAKSINLPLFTLILYGFGVRCDLGRFSVLSPFIVKSMHGTMCNHFSVIQGYLLQDPSYEVQSLIIFKLLFRSTEKNDCW